MRKIVIYLFFSFAFTFQCNAQFKLLTDSLRGLRNGEVTWTDFDSDGDIDIISFGDDTLAQIHTTFYRNNDSVFNEFDIDVFPDLYDGAIDWADYDNNGHLDLALIGWSSNDATVISRIITFDSTFTNSNINLPGVSRGSIDWGDYNNDGFSDLLIVGQDIQSNSITKLFENRDSVFVEVNTPEVTGVSFGDAAWADYNSDGLLDFIITGVTGQAPNTGPPITHLYKNIGNGFELVFETLFVGLHESSIDWGDADNDGDLDLLITGFTENYKAFTGLYLNDSSSFRLVETTLPNIIEGFAKWGDFDNDNDLDILITGDTVGLNGRIFKVYENDSLHFNQVYEGPGVGQSSGGWADFNNDGFLDIIINGQKNDLGLLASIYLNEGVKNKNAKNYMLNSPPTIPTNLDVELEGTKAKLIWKPSEDESTLSASLSYSIYLLKEDHLIIPSLSNNSGVRSVVEPGNAGIVTFYITNDLVPGNYTWSVQAIDNSFIASSFAPSNSFIICEQSTETDIITACDSYTWIDGNTYTSSNNTAIHTLTNINGCDSVVTLDLTINTVDISVSENGFTLTANENGANYQWINCNDNNNHITGETNQSFTATVNGSYAVIVDNSLCVDTSICYTITGVGINEIEEFGISIYPNPVNDVVEIDLGKNHIDKISITDISGKKIIERIPVSQNEKINISDFDSGIYIIIFETKKEVYTLKIIKK